MSSPSSTATRARPAASATLPGVYGRVTAWLSKRVEMALAEMDLTLPQYRVLGILAEGSAAASGLADRASVARPSITALIDGLVARGLVDRKADEHDRRRIALKLTPRGERTVAEADRKVDDYLASIASHLPSKDEAMALRSLELWGQALATHHQARHNAAEDSAAR